jgi:DNA-directed RNA polymerase specialized sigma24 family protein
MPGQSRENQERLPEFYLSPAVKGRSIEPEVQSAFSQLWPWFWDFVGKELGDADRAADLADEIAYRVSKYLQEHPGQVRSVVGLCRVAAVNFVTTTKTREGRIDYRGLGQDIEANLNPIAADWQEDIDISIWVDQVFRGEDTETRRMVQLRLLEETWDQIGDTLGLTGGQARLRFYRALERIHADLIFRGPRRGRS